MKNKHYMLSVDFVNGMGCSISCETKDEVLEELKKYDHEGATWSVDEIHDVTDEIEKLYTKR